MFVLVFSNSKDVRLYNDCMYPTNYFNMYMFYIRPVSYDNILIKLVL